MRMAEGVEWALHSCLLLAWVEQDAVSAARLARYYQLPPAYLNKQLQALSKAGILTSLSGPRGGFRLARPPERITLMDVVAAIEGPEAAFRCTEIRQRVPLAGPGVQFPAPCSIAGAMRKAELAWRHALAEQTLADVMAATERSTPEASDRARRWFEDTRA
jgi:Rrf2 family protein